MILYTLQPKLPIAGGTNIYFKEENRVGEGDEEENNKNEKKNVEGKRKLKWSRVWSGESGKSAERRR